MFAALAAAWLSLNAPETAADGAIRASTRGSQQAGRVVVAASRMGRTAAVSVGPTAAVVETTADLRRALTPLRSLQFGDGAPGGIATIKVNDARSFQRFRGVGGAMTDSSAWLIQDGLGRRARALVLASLFGPGGIRLNFLRVPIGASDFTVGGRPYSYDDLRPHANDPALLHFSIAHDVRYVLPALREARALDPEMFLVASPWSPPGWMKTNDSLDNVQNGGTLKSSDYGPLARYFVKFLKAYAAAGVTVDAITPQNEPGNPTRYPGMNLSEAGEARLIADNLAPALARARLHTQIYGFDWGWTTALLGFAKALASGPAGHDLTGLATHCYFGSPEAMSSLHASFPRLDEIESECSPGITPYSTSELEISSLRNWASTVALWNLALDLGGGPVQEPNTGCPGCSGVVTIDPHTHQVTLTASYFELGQVSRFVEPGAIRIGSNTFVRYSYPGPNQNIASPGLDDVAFRNPDGSEVLVAYNNSHSTIRFAVDSHGRYVVLQLAGGATATLSWQVSRGSAGSAG